MQPSRVEAGLLGVWCARRVGTRGLGARGDLALPGSTAGPGGVRASDRRGGARGARVQVELPRVGIARGAEKLACGARWGARQTDVPPFGRVFRGWLQRGICGNGCFVHDDIRKTQVQGRRIRLQQATPAQLPKVLEAA